MAFASRASGHPKGQPWAARASRRPSGAPLSLTLAVISASPTPLLLLDEDLRVIAASTSFCSSFQIDPASVSGRTIFNLGAGQWDMAEVRSLLEATASGAVDIETYEIDMRASGRSVRRLVLRAKKLSHDEALNIRVLLAVTDVTEIRVNEKLKDDLLQEKIILLQEVQHRVANSLQIIASVLLQSARKVRSQETRSHLHDAHNRVMSIAAVQRQLAASRLGDVDLRAYFAQLCQSLSTSMIRDHDRLTLEVSTDDTIVSADTSVSLGLIVTELVINALKYAFPGRRRGKIFIAYRAVGPDWALTIRDNGVGMPRAPAKPGLGTSIVEALAHQLGARIDVADAEPGTLVTIAHREDDVMAEQTAV
jgi:two-component sensor histidine kinase